MLESEGLKSVSYTHLEEIDSHGDDDGAEEDRGEIF